MHAREGIVLTMSVCGQGYLWPSTILLTDEYPQVTCQKCRELLGLTGGNEKL